MIAVGSAAGSLLDQEADPLAQGLLAVVATVDAMLAVSWWRSARR